MSTYDPIAYTYDADVHCPDCAEERYGRGADGFIAEDCEDSEGNPVHIIAPWDEWQSFNDDGPEALYCGTCGELIDKCGPSQSWLERMHDAYVECALWADMPRDEDDEHVDAELDEESACAMEADADRFAEDNAELLVGLDAAQVGHDFWLTRNGHGAGFWDRGLGRRGEQLTESADAYGECYLYLGDDGKVHVS